MSMCSAKRGEPTARISASPCASVSMYMPGSGSISSVMSSSSRISRRHSRMLSVSSSPGSTAGWRTWSSRMKPLPKVTSLTPSRRATRMPRLTRSMRRLRPATSSVISDGSCGRDGVKKCEAVATQAGTMRAASSRARTASRSASPRLKGLNWSRWKDSSIPA